MRRCVKTRTSNLAGRSLICLALGLITLAVFARSLTHGFLVYDDQAYVTENPHVKAGLTWQGVQWAFRSYAVSNWHPLTWLSHMLDYQLYGLRAWGHHLTNLLLHIANTLLLFEVLRRMTGALWRSALVAALFAWHPLHVESVAWVAERKDVLSAFFFMLTLWAYGRYVEGRMQNEECRMKNVESGNTHHAPRSTTPSSILHPPSSFYYVLALLVFALGLMSKPMVVTLPFVLLLLDYWPLGRFQASTLRRVLLEKLPFLALSAVGCVLTVSAQQPSIVSTAGLRISQRLEHALVAYAHYCGALFVPRRLAVYYPYEKTVPAAEVVFAGLLLLALTILAFRFAGRRPYLATGWLWFLGMLVPVLGLVQVGEQAWADRYTYLPSIGLFIAVVWGLSELAQREHAARTILRWLAAAVGLALLIGTSVQLSYWKDTRTLFEHAAQVTRNNPLAATLLGSLLANDGKFDEAIEYYRTALRYAPGFPEAHFYLGHALDQQGKLDEAIAEYQKAVWYKPIQEQTHLAYGAALAKQGKPDQAAAHYLAAIKLNPQSAVAHNNLAKLLHAQGRLDEAIQHYSVAVESDPGLAQAHNNLGVLLLQKGRVAEGVAQLREALRLKPGDHESQLNLAQGLVEQEQWSEAAALFSKTVTAATADPNVHYQFATALAHLRQTRQAMSQYASALLLQQDFPAALDGLSWILATDADPQVRNGDQAYAMSERACELVGRKDPEKLKTLAAACAETGRFSQALSDAQAALDLASKNGQKEVADECRLMLVEFRAGKRWRAPR
jgi:tetratricopeptide (TPR) repeat protein